MVTPKVSDIVGIINKIAPLHLAEEWDNPGLQVGDPGAQAPKIVVALDVTPETVKAAVEAQASLLVTHHPLIFKSLKKISLAEPTGRLLATAISNNLAIVSMHTNYDSAPGGLNDLLARLLGLGDLAPLKVSYSEELAKVAVFVPQGHEEAVLEALLRFSGFIGNYSDCSFQTVGVGTFKPLTGAQPFIGAVGKRESVQETKLEVLVRRPDVAAAVAAMLKAHPYEEPAYDIYSLWNRGISHGTGRLGKLDHLVPLADFAAHVKNVLRAPVRVVSSGKETIRKVAVCSGSGASFIMDAKRGGADVLVTGDVKYHDARQAQDLGLALIDAGHFATEIIMAEEVARRLSEECCKRGYDCDIAACHAEKEPFEYLL